MQLLYFCSFLDKKVCSQGELLSTVNIQNKFKSVLIWVYKCILYKQKSALGGVFKVLHLVFLFV